MTDLQKKGKVLSLLHELDQPQIASEIGEMLGLSTGDVTGILTDLYIKGLVMRHHQYVGYLNREEFFYKTVSSTTISEGVSETQKRKELVRDLLIWVAPNALCQRQVSEILSIPKKSVQLDLKAILDDDVYITRETRVDDKTGMECYFYWWTGKRLAVVENPDQEKLETPNPKKISPETQNDASPQEKSLRELVEECDVELPDKFLGLFNSGQLEMIKSFLVARNAEIQTKKSIIG